MTPVAGPALCADSNNPEAGLKVKYSGGDACEAIDNQPRSIVYNLHVRLACGPPPPPARHRPTRPLPLQCDPEARETSITGETEGTDAQVCHYSLDWKSPVACPSSTGSSLGTSIVY